MTHFTDTDLAAVLACARDWQEREPPEWADELMELHTLLVRARRDWDGKQRWRPEQKPVEPQVYAGRWVAGCVVYGVG